MKTKMNNWVNRFFFSENIPFQGRVFNLVLCFGLAAESIMFFVAFLQRLSLPAILWIVAMIVVTAGILWVCNKFKRYRLGTWLVLIAVCDIFFALTFFDTGGIDSGMTAYFVLCIALIFLLLKGIDCAIVLASHLAVILVCYIASLWHPHLATPFETDLARHIDVIVAIIVSGILAGLLIKYQNRIYEIEKNKAEAASRAKAEFLANVSREIRTPLNVIIALGELELSNSLPNDTLNNLEKIHNSGMGLLSVINDLLDISKIESGHFELFNVEYETPTFINDAVSLNMGRMGGKPIIFRLDIDENLPVKLFGDELRIRQILNNLLSNAFKYTQEGTVVLKIHCEPFEQNGGPSVYSPEDMAEKLWLVCSVEDTGMGIRAEDMGAIFSAYRQADTGSRRAVEDTGMGLSICKYMTELMGGSISVQSEFGKGSIFTIRIPQEIRDWNPLGKKMAEYLATFQFSARKWARRKTIQYPMPYARVLVVDDVSDNLDVARRLMTPYGLTVDCAESGREAINIIREKSVTYDAVFMDHMMPGMDGIEAVRVIRREIPGDYARTVPVIALTTNTLIDSDNMFMENGFQDFLTKPIDSSKLDVVLNKWVRNEEKERSAEWAAAIEKIKSGANAKQAEMPPEQPSIPGVNFAAGIKHVGGKEEVFVRILTAFSSGMPALLDAIRGFRPHALNEYSVTIHGIKGSCYNICADDVGKQAEAMEMAAKNGDIETILAGNDELVIQLEKLIEDIKKYLQTT